MESIEPRRAVEMYLRDREDELSQASIYSHRSHLKHFVEWCAESSLDDLSQLTPLKIREYKLWRRDTGDLNRVTMNTQLGTIKVFVKWAESLNLVKQGLAEKIHLPSLAKGEDERDVMLDEDVADVILGHLERFEYATFDHVSFTLMWRGLLRRGAVRAIDLEDVKLDDENASIELVHRPETGTPLKNQYEADRFIAISDETRNVIEDYVKHHRHDVTDECGRREPLLTTSQGRPHVTTIQASSYAVTRPCAVGCECPHSRDENECDAARDRQEAFRCPSSVSPHAVRRGAITHWLRRDVPDTVTGNRASSSPEILDRHYDQRTEREKMEQRRRYLDNLE